MSHQIPAIRFRQWLAEWDGFEFDPEQKRNKPEPYVYMFSMSAVQLRALSGVYRRRRDEGMAEGLQRLHDPARSRIIRDFVRFGHPYSGLKGPLRNKETESLKKPGWLPTAIVVNILGADDERRGRRVATDDLVSIVAEGHGRFSVTLPYGDRMTRWAPTGLEPFEVIDGQHRLWAFDETADDEALPDDFELPVVAFCGLDIGWQAYLFWSINVSPKRINPSHAFDLFPLLRSEAWLETSSELKFYREARAQELTELLFRHPASPWYNRINMLGESAKTAPEGAGVTQAGWVRALTSTFLASGAGSSAPGLFSAQISRANGPLDWSRAQQAAFLMVLWQLIKVCVIAVKEPWAEALREEFSRSRLIPNQLNPEFDGSRTMLNQEQGVRGILSIANELFYRLATQQRRLFEWSTTTSAGGDTAIEDVTIAVDELQTHALKAVMQAFSNSVAKFDWRSADSSSLTDTQRLLKRAFRGSGGYVALREQLRNHVASEIPDFSNFSRRRSTGGDH